MRKLIVAVALACGLMLVVDRQFLQPYREHRATVDITRRPAPTNEDLQRLIDQLNREDRAATRPASQPMP